MCLLTAIGQKAVNTCIMLGESMMRELIECRMEAEK